MQKWEGMKYKYCVAVPEQINLIIFKYLYTIEKMFVTFVFRSVYKIQINK